ncbi:MAG TPA: LysE family translocator [Jatrophihabitans sp.]|nr:LysE family translocator [Jatrophihabitans sp.]
MPTSGHLLAFALMSLVVVAIPGPSVLFTISRALTIGRRGALLTVLGNAAGQWVQVVAVACGLGAFVERSVLLFSVIKLLGAGYLVYLGVQAVRHRRALARTFGDRAVRLRSARRVVADGFVVGVTNPKSIVLYVAALPQFVAPDAGSATLQMLVLGSVFPVIALALDSVWAVAAGGARSWLGRSPRRLTAVGGTGGLSLIGLGATLAVTGRGD